MQHKLSYKSGDQQSVVSTLTSSFLSQGFRTDRVPQKSHHEIAWKEVDTEAPYRWAIGRALVLRCLVAYALR
jgi:hypothetical protein